MFNFYFIDNVTGEDFIVQANGYHEAVREASKYFEEPCFERVLSDYEAEMIGVDTYQKGAKNGNRNRKAFNLYRLYIICNYIRLKGEKNDKSIL